jgi:hypothetical protein
MAIEIPKGKFGDTPATCRIRPARRQTVEAHYPLQLRRLCWSALHRVHADGTVTASFFHAKGNNYAIGEDPNGCGWHAFLKLND